MAPLGDASSGLTTKLTCPVLPGRGNRFYHNPARQHRRGRLSAWLAAIFGIQSIKVSSNTFRELVPVFYEPKVPLLKFFLGSKNVCFAL
jgi:hypothetical protein